MWGIEEQVLHLSRGLQVSQATIVSFDQVFVETGGFLASTFKLMINEAGESKAKKW
ncbi:hypothetical protein [Enterococcus pallens]|uniref:Uncharacterized protein n=1 Tax=Enterococcus pallens ATCC BAA-351 TaxID=1158607 RepID=R2QGZ9_9ENTE|nr:hypothetical protein [Enterococcus pallens]EOH94468.1 hypothetical protein UAU_02203 [Enterococcus pallens ATCC BAA-351]EOU24347.1 hypothetical protein I588_00334 [Enterococcus pallens ATCC BAA-351]OJG81871.1 hypothetical protein RV10_GL001735 [Enterococcus pallens]